MLFCYSQSIEVSDVVWSFDDKSDICYGITLAKFTHPEADYVCKHILGGRLSSAEVVKGFTLEHLRQRKPGSNDDDHYGIWIFGKCK